MIIFETYNDKQRFHPREKGQSLVELAIGITILLILVSGIVDVGRAIFTQFALQDAAEEGLVYGIGYPDQCDQIISRVTSTLQNSILPTTPNVTVKIASAPCGTVALTYGMRMDVEVSSVFTMLMPFFFGDTITLQGTANGTILRPPPET